MKARLLIFFLLFTATRMSAQQVVPDSIYDQLNKTSNDTLKLFLLDKIAGSYEENNWDSALYYEAKSLPLAKELYFSILEANIHDQLGYIHTHRGNFAQALADFLTGIEIIKDPGLDKNPDDSKTNWYFKYFGTKQFADIRSQTLGWLHLHLGHLYGSVGNYRDQVNQYFICEKYWHDSVSLTFVFMNLGGAYVNMNKLDSALFYETKGLSDSQSRRVFLYYFKLLKILGIDLYRPGQFSIGEKIFLPGCYHRSFFQ